MPARISLFARDLPADWPIHALNLSVLYTRESSGEWCARAGGNGHAQVSFAIQRRAPELVLKDAPAVYLLPPAPSTAPISNSSIRVPGGSAW